MTPAPHGLGIELQPDKGKPNVAGLIGGFFVGAAVLGLELGVSVGALVVGLALGVLVEVKAPCVSFTSKSNHNCIEKLTISKSANVTYS